ncbi:hypothetical protein CPB83DRAFT_852231 [Crepidotus variabilis]|uniref:C2 domain-containing protein n=1 Tax=Crepidotus variabilis TaxID=179855 RepID=A0A9P6JRR3_9AGAR|nr:hypothetical protein CPB83DRAFT_852231 [Crepidotus variabilis]
MLAEYMTEIDSFKTQHNIVFHIAQVEGLPPRSGWNARPGTSVSLQVGTKETYTTENKKMSPGSTAWSENLPQLQMSGNANVQFQLKTHKMLAKRKVLGTSGTYNIEQLLKMQGAEPDGLIKLPIVLETPTRSPPGSPKTPRSPRSSFASFRSNTTQTGTFLEVPNMLPPSSPIGSVLRRTPTNSPPSSPGSPHFATLLVAIRETPVDPEFNSRVNAANLKAFVDRCRTESLERIRSTIETLDPLTRAFEHDTAFGSLIDLVFGALEATRQLLANPDTMNINRHIIHIMKALDGAFSHYQNLSQRQLEKRGESSVALLQEMLLSVLNTVCIVDTIFTEHDAFSRDRLESKLINWIEYFQQCATYIDGQSDQRPALPSHRSSTRTHYPKVLDANLNLPKHNMVTMALPDIDPSKPHNHSSTIRQIAEWIFSPIPNERQVTPRASAISYAPRRSGSTSPPPLSPPLSPVSSISPASSPRQMKKPSSLLLKAEDNNFQSNPIELKSILKSPVMSTPAPRDMGFSPTLFYLSAPNGGDNDAVKQVTAALCESLAQTKSLGGYFSFAEAVQHSDNSAVETSEPSRDYFVQGLLDALPMTLVHQLATVETEITDQLAASFKNTSVSQAIHDKLIGKFDILFSDQVKSFVEKTGPKNAKWNPLEPLVFVIDAIGLGMMVGDKEGEGADMKEAQLLVEWLSSRGLRRLPAHIRFLILSSSGSIIETTFKQRGVKGCGMGSVLGDKTEENQAAYVR